MSYLVIDNKAHMGVQAAIQEVKLERSVFLQKLSLLPLESAINDWLDNLHPPTKRNYKYYMNDLISRGILPPITVGEFNCMPHEKMIDHIKSIKDWSEGTRQVKAACYISLTSYLERISQGWFRRVKPSTLASNKTFFTVRDKCETRALSLHEWHKFITALYKINKRDAIIAKAILQGAKRVSEVLSLEIEQIDFQKNIINYIQSKTKGMIKKIPISYPGVFMDELKDYIDDTDKIRNGNTLVFISKFGNRVFRTQLNFSFIKASKKAKVHRVTPHVLRASWVTLAKSQGIPDSEIMKVTGHVSSRMIYAYDKSSAEDNYSKKLVLI